MLRSPYKKESEGLSSPHPKYTHVRVRESSFIFQTFSTDVGRKAQIERIVQFTWYPRFVIIVNDGKPLLTSLFLVRDGAGVLPF